MRKLLITVITIFLSINILHSEKVLKGKVKEYTEYVYNIEYKFGEPSKILKSSNKFVFVYDSKGNKIERARFKSDGSLLRKYKYKYDSKGNQIEAVYYNSDGFLDWKYKWKYDSKGNKIESVCYNSDGSFDWKYKYKYKYDSKGNQIERARYEVEIKFGEKQLILTAITEYKYIYYK